MVLKKKMAVICVTALLLCMAVYLNWNYQKSDGIPDLTVSDGGDIIDSNRVLGDLQYVSDTPDDGEVSSVGQSDYFAEVRLTRQITRDEALSILREGSSNTDTSEAARDAASVEMSKLAASAVRETRIESLIKAKGFSDCVCIISDSSVNVVVPSGEDGLNAQDVAKIKDIAVNECEISAEAVKIVELR